MRDNLIIKTQSRIVSFMDRLKADPPGCLLLEGGTPEQRKILSLYWAMILNCRAECGPCLECRPCIQMKDEECRDLFQLGPGNKVEEIRSLRTIYPQKPHYSWRIIIISDAQDLRAESANALLKSLEEPRPGNSFVLLAPQRESLFSTLVSRSFVLTLSRGTDISYDEETETAFTELAHFACTGKGWLDRTSGRNKPDMIMAGKIISRCRYEIISSGLRKDRANLFDRVPPAAGYQVQAILKKAEHCLTTNNIRVDLVMEWLAVSLWKTIHQFRHVK